MCTDDKTLMEQFARDGSDQAFTALVSRHLPFVYSVALRKLNGDAHLAEDATQLVFTNLARKAASLPSNTVLAGWLHRDTCYTALEILRKEKRRRAREDQAIAMDQTSPQESSALWEQICPWLDEILRKLNRTDRDALLLRYFEQRTLAEIGERLGFGESGASRRISRALEKARVLLAKRGVVTSAGALSLALMAHALPAAPPAIVASIAGTSLASAAIPAASTSTIAQIIMASLKLKVGIAAALGVALLVPVLVTQHVRERHARTVQATQRETVEHLNSMGRQVLALIMFAGNNDDKLPSSLEEIGLPDDQYELVFHGPLPKNLQERAATPIIREKQPWLNDRGTWARAYGYADGHSVVLVEQGNQVAGR